MIRTLQSALLVAALAAFVTTPCLAAPDAVAMVSGTVTAVSDTAVVVQQDDKPLATFAVTAKTSVLIDGKAASPADIKPGYLANLDVVGGTVTSLYARTPDTDAWGKIAAVSDSSITVTGPSGDPRVFAIDGTTKVIVFTKAGSSSDLTVGMLADVKFGMTSPKVASSIAVVRSDGGLFRGKVTVVSASSITLSSMRKATTTFTVPTDAAVTLDGKAAKMADIHVGAFAEVTAADGATATVVAVRTRAAGGRGGREGGGDDGGGDGDRD